MAASPRPKVSRLTQTGSGDCDWLRNLCRSLGREPPALVLRGGARAYAIAEKTQGNTIANRHLTLSIVAPESVE